MGETSVDMNKENELRDDATIFLTDKIGFSHEENIKQMERVNLTEILDKTDGVMKRLNKTLQKVEKRPFKSNNNFRKRICNNIFNLRMLCSAEFLCFYYIFTIS